MSKIILLIIFNIASVSLCAQNNYSFQVSELVKDSLLYKNSKFEFGKENVLFIKFDETHYLAYPTHSKYFISIKKMYFRNNRRKYTLVIQPLSTGQSVITYVGIYNNIPYFSYDIRSYGFDKFELFNKRLIYKHMEDEFISINKLISLNNLYLLINNDRTEVKIK